MLRLTKYLKPYFLPLLFAIILLFIQANCDLALPDYMSRIVNVGIQQGGVDSANPIAVRQTEMDRLLIFMSTDEKSEVLGSYTLVDKESAGFDQTVKEFPALANEPIYIQNKLDQTKIESLKPVMAKAFLAVSGIEKALADPASAAAFAQDQEMGFDFSKLPPGIDIFTILAKLPETQLARMMDVIDKRFEALGGSMLNQGAVVAVKAEYAALGMDTGKLQNAYILRTGFLMLLVALVSAASTIAVGFYAAKTAAGFSRDLRRFIFQKVESFSSAEFDQFSTASLITRSTNDITQIQMVTVMMVRMVFYAPIIGVGGVIRAMGKDVSMWWIIALAVSILVILIFTVYTIAVPKFKLIQALIDRLNLVARENLSGMMVIRAFNRQSFEEHRFDRANVDLTETSLFVNRVMVIMMPLMMLVMNGLTLLIIWVGAHQVAQATMQVGDMMAFMQYTIQIVFAFLMLSMMFIILPRADVSANRIADVLETKITIQDPQNPKQFIQPFKGTVEFRNVSFAYPDAEEDVLHDINFIAKPGETTAIIGSTGSGKSTIISLLPRFYDVTGGAIYLDGVDIRDVTQHELRNKIGYIPQKSTLFSGTIESNLRYADKDASDDSLKIAAETAQIKEFIESLPEGMAAEISQGGTNVSGGQKQRLSIARALVKKPPIYIFDDSFSALDFKTDSALRKALKTNTASSTILIVTQRVSTIIHAEQIIVLEEGRIISKGTHNQLMEDCPTYREITSSQLGGNGGLA